MSHKGTIKKYIVILSTVLLILAAVGLWLICSAETMLKPPTDKYGIILDAGSSHTSMFVYKWPADKQNGTGIVTQHSECHAEGGGISSYAGVPGGAAKSLETCLEQAVKDIPKTRHQQTPLALGATAGMRILDMANSAESERILNEVKNKLQSSPFKFEEAAILTGQQEGGYGWVTVNYLEENFVKYGFVGRWLNPGRDTVGALDLGGASTQITFETSAEMENSNNSMELMLYGKTYKIYTQSFLCYGQDQFLKKLIAHLIKTQGVRPQVTHPCYPKQFNTSVNLGKDVFDSPCTEQYRPAQFNPNVSVTLVGTGNYVNCLTSVRQMFSFDNCSYSQCSFNGVFQPSVRGTFMAFSGFYFNYKNIRLAKNPITSPSQMENATQLICNMSISKMIETTNGPEQHLKNVCAVSIFVHVLLSQGYNFTNLSISFEEKAGGVSVGWALGYMLNLTNMVPAESSELKTLSLINWYGAVVIFILISILAVKILLFLRNTILKILRCNCE